MAKQKSDEKDDAETLAAFSESEESNETEPVFSLEEVSAIIAHNVSVGLLHLPPSPTKTV